MPERAILREYFSDMLQTASAAAAEYDRLAAATADPDRRDQLQKMLRDEYRHVELTERLLEIIDE